MRVVPLKNVGAEAVRGSVKFMRAGYLLVEAVTRGSPFWASFSPLLPLAASGLRKNCHSVS